MLLSFLISNGVYLGLEGWPWQGQCTPESKLCIEQIVLPSGLFVMRVACLLLQQGKVAGSIQILGSMNND
jgi:hypothetical protein